MRRLDRKVPQALRIAIAEGRREVARQILRALLTRLGHSALDFPLAAEDVIDSRTLDLPVPTQRPQRGTPLTIGWICTPPALGSGGHTTFFRMVKAAESAGHRSFIYLYDRYQGSLASQAQLIRASWPDIAAEVRDASGDLPRHDAYVASSWPTAHVLGARARFPTRRLYFIQDFEPYFYGHGPEYALAADTYKFGFRNIAVGNFVAEILASNYDVNVDVAPHGCDTETYGLTNFGDRRGVVFYAKPGVARRGFELGILALLEFHKRLPNEPIHVFGDDHLSLPLPALNHGKVSPHSLNDLYNRCRVGLVMSFTNVSLVPAEMLACGMVPVLCGAYDSADLDSPFLHLAEPSPSAIADELCRIFSEPQESSHKIASSAVLPSWLPAQQKMVRTIEEETYGLGQNNKRR